MTPTHQKLVLPLLDPSALHACRQVCRQWKSTLQSDAYYLRRFEWLGLQFNGELTLAEVKAFFPLIPSVKEPSNTFISLTLRLYALFGKITDDLTLTNMYRNTRCTRWKNITWLTFQIATENGIEEISYTHPEFCDKGWYITIFDPSKSQTRGITPVTDDLIQILALRSEIVHFRRALASQNPEFRQ